MGVPPDGQTGPRAVIFDLDHSVIDSATAWSYAVEEAVALVAGRRVDCRRLVEGYQWRPWRDALRVVLDRGEDAARCEALCEVLFSRSAMKRLTVFDGIGVGLDRLRAGRIEIGGITRHAHAVARRQLESTGIDRFLTVLSSQPPGETWNATARIRDCLVFLECPPGRAALVAADPFELSAATKLGLRAFGAGWVRGAGERLQPAVPDPRELQRSISAAWRRS